MPQYRVFQSVSPEGAEVILVSEFEDLMAAEDAISLIPDAHIEMADGLVSVLIERAGPEAQPGNQA